MSGKSSVCLKIFLELGGGRFWLEVGEEVAIHCYRPFMNSKSAFHRIYSIKSMK